MFPFTHRKQLHRYRNRQLFTEVCIKLLSNDETNYSDDADNKSSNVCLGKEITQLHHSLERKNGDEKQRDYLEIYITLIITVTLK